MPPAHMPLLRGKRPLKRWRYVAIFCEDLMACAAIVQVGPARQSFWAVLVPAAGPAPEPSSPAPRLLERTRLLPRRAAVELGPGRLRVHDAGAVEHRWLPGSRERPLLTRARHRETGAARVTLDLRLEEDAGVEALCPHGRDGYVWTRKQAGIAARGTIAIGGAPPRTIDALAVVDDTAGYHARVTEWWWAAGVGTDPTGAPLAFNLVQGVNDPPRGSERAVWVAGAPREVAPVSFAPDLSRIAGEDGLDLRFAPQAQRSRRENLLLVRSEYRAPFGSFGGTLPGGVELASGLGVVEHHRARW